MVIVIIVIVTIIVMSNSNKNTPYNSNYRRSNDTKKEVKNS